VAQAEHCAALGEYQEASKRTRRGFPLVAMALIHRNWHDEAHVALYYLTRAIVQDPHYLRARALRAECQLQLGDVKGAMRDVSHALHKAPGHAVLLALHAECLLRLGRVREVAARRSTVPLLTPHHSSCPLACSSHTLTPPHAPSHTLTHPHTRPHTHPHTRPHTRPHTHLQVAADCFSLAA